MGRAWLHELIDVGRRSRLPHVVSLPYLQRIALTLAQGHEAGIEEAKRTAAKNTFVPLSFGPGEAF